MRILGWLLGGCVVGAGFALLYPYRMPWQAWVPATASLWIGPQVWRWIKKPSPATQMMTDFWLGFWIVSSAIFVAA